MGWSEYLRNKMLFALDFTKAPAQYVSGRKWYRCYIPSAQITNYKVSIDSKKNCWLTNKW